MPKLLAIDSSSSTTKVALSVDGKFQEYKTEKPRLAAQRLLPLIQQALSEALLDISQLDAIATVTGPGSFTGLRIGLGVAQGLSMANSTPLIGISSLALLAHAASQQFEHEMFLVCLPAREQEVYFGAYSRNGTNVLLQNQERVVEFNDSAEELPNFSTKSLLGIGPGWQDKETLEAKLGIELADCKVDLDASMEDLCEFALEKLAREETVQAEELLPNYVKEQLDYRS
ncbi:MAG: tRNA (adenosine(37)-N6)-threonylcarbamoyltransferase complex dimerization subunit type 1 TsaB [Pseudomonadales bacterium]|nr:tRNA (adenosine(37)-N6)-threonylcarbamoyltransferase complex dimerization subunit type 1 TsaB [Pseudomonadales bacterium]